MTFSCFLQTSSSFRTLVDLCCRRCRRSCWLSCATDSCTSSFSWSRFCNVNNTLQRYITFQETWSQNSGTDPDGLLGPEIPKGAYQRRERTASQLGSVYGNCQKNDSTCTTPRGRPSLAPPRKPERNAFSLSLLVEFGVVVKIDGDGGYGAILKHSNETSAKMNDSNTANFLLGLAFNRLQAVESIRGPFFILTWIPEAVVKNEFILVNCWYHPLHPSPRNREHPENDCGRCLTFWSWLCNSRTSCLYSRSSADWSLKFPFNLAEKKNEKQNCWQFSFKLTFNFSWNSFDLSTCVQILAAECETESLSRLPKVHSNLFRKFI